MFRLIKLAMYAMIGYALYEIYLGMTQQSGSRSFAGGGGGASGEEMSFGRSQGGNVGQLTGAGAGMSDTTGGTDGGEMRHTVGRGVVSGNRNA